MAKKPKPEPTADVATEVVTLQDVVDEAVSIARSMRATGVGVCVRQTPCGKLPPPLDHYPNGIGGQTFFGVYLETDWLKKHEPFYETLVQADAHLVCAAMEDLKEASWRITQNLESAPGPTVVDPMDPDDLLASSQEAEPMARIRQRAPRGLGGGLPRRKSSRGSSTGGRRTRTT